MSRAEITDVVQSSNGRLISGAAVRVLKLDGSLASVYAARTGGTPLPQPLNTVKGIISGWVEIGSYTLEITYQGKVSLEAFEAFSAEDLKTGITGPVGPKGDVGAQGIQGVPGPKGDLGPAGPLGSVGDPGPRGEQGLQGPVGIQGPAGTGAPGDQGPRGYQGEIGPKGDTGDVGPQGAQGAQGVQGVKGNTGSTGAKGSTGATGADGAPGATGAQGPKGDTGAAGTNGLNANQQPRRVVSQTGTTITPNVDATDIVKATLTANATLANPTGTPSDGQTFNLWLTQDATGGRALAFDTAYGFSSDLAAPTLSGASKKDKLAFSYDADAAKWHLMAVLRGF